MICWTHIESTASEMAWPASPSSPVALGALAPSAILAALPFDLESLRTAHLCCAPAPQAAQVQSFVESMVQAALQA